MQDQSVESEETLRESGSRGDGLYRQRDEASEVARSPIGRSLDVYADAVGGGP